MTAEEFVTEIKSKSKNKSVSPLCYDRLIYLMGAYKKHELKELQYYKDTSLGLWCTDRPDLVEDKNKIMFQLV